MAGGSSSATAVLCTQTNGSLCTKYAGPQQCNPPLLKKCHYEYSTPVLGRQPTWDHQIQQQQQYIVSLTRSPSSVIMCRPLYFLQSQLVLVNPTHSVPVCLFLPQTLPSQQLSAQQSQQQADGTTTAVLPSEQNCCGAMARTKGPHSSQPKLLVIL